MYSSEEIRRSAQRNFEKPWLRLKHSNLHVGLLAILFFTANGALFRFGPVTSFVWIIASILIVIQIAKHPKFMSKMLARHWAILILPLFAILSTAWSTSPQDTAIDGVQMLLTCTIALHFSKILSTRQIMTSLAIALVGATVMSVVNITTGLWSPVYETNGALLGIFTQKNNFAKAVFWGAFALTAVSLYNGKIWLAIIYCLVTIPLTINAASKTGQIGYLFIILLLVAAIALGLSARAKSFCFAILCLIAAPLTIIYVYTGGAPIDDMLNVLGKSPTLTGRTVIWDIGIEVWKNNILVGIGLNAFWSSPLYADAIAIISNNVDDGLHGFHNVYIEYLVAFGIIGSTYLIILLSATWMRIFSCYIASPAVDTIIWLTILSAIIVLGVFEDSFSKPRSGHLMLAVMAISYSQRPTKRFH